MQKDLCTVLNSKTKCTWFKMKTKTLRHFLDVKSLYVYMINYI